ncbi:MAG TPA: isocitrate/isopropylmalate family dehydrogenase, partial [Desulfobaccales bacterium]|nr:isocitrate/isopropylmalate family dehydrogenase [Desulfobaccales bacterium]
MVQPKHGQGEVVTASPAGLVVPDQPIILYIEGDGTGPDISRATRPVLDAAVARAYGDSRRIVWQEVMAGEKAFKLSRSYLPVETLTALRE